jgi:Ser/Thr protein kinase RdoA (MazF antagonist)
MTDGSGISFGPHYSPDLLSGLEDALRAALAEWSLSPRTEVALLNISENATFDLHDPEEGRRLVVRVYRRGYHEPAEIRSEIAWIRALRAESVARIHAPVAGRDGEVLRRLTSRHDDAMRLAAAFEFVPGREADQDGNLVERFRDLGRITALLHDHSRRWERPPCFVRKTWDFAATLGEAAVWGCWQSGLGLDSRGRALLQRAVEIVDRRLAQFGSGPDRFGLIHADLRLANLLADGDALTVIDFDDCGFGWFAYDFAASVSFMEHEPIVPALFDAWVSGYRGVGALAAEVVAEMPVFVMLRRILLVAWIASHAETPTAEALGSGYTEGTLAMAEDFLARFG